MFDGTTFSAKDIQDAKEICSLHNRQLPAIKELRAKLDLGLREAKQLCDDIWSSVEHPENVEYDGLDRIVSEPINCIRVDASIGNGMLFLVRSNGEQATIKLSKDRIQELKDFGVPTGEKAC